MSTKDTRRRDTAASSASISVVMCTYNGARFLREQLASLARQTRPPVELVVGDDGSTDETMDIVAAFARSSPFPVHVSRNDVPLGFRDNFLETASRATGDFVAFCDQDDVWEPGKLAACGEGLDDPALAMVVHAARLIDGEGADIGGFPQGIPTDRLAPPLSYDPWHTFWGFSIVFRRDILTVTRTLPRFRDYIAPDHAIAHDRWICFWAQMLGATRELAEPLVRYRQHGRNVFGSGGAGAPRKSRAAAIAEARVYVDVTRAMLDLIDALDPGAERLFPSFDRAKARRFLARAYRQQVSRLAVYQAAPLPALGRILRMLIDGRYRAVHDGRLRTRSIARDLQVTFAGLLAKR